MLDAGPGYQAPGVEATGVGVGRLLDAVGVEDDGAGEFGEFLVLVLPGTAEVAHQVGVLLQAGIAVGREHLAVGVDVDPLAFGLLEEFFQHQQVVAGNQDRLAGLGAQLYFCRYRVAVALHVSFVQEPHDGQVVLAALHGEPDEVHQAEGRVDGGGQGLVEKGIDLIVVLAEDLAVVGIGGHPLETVDENLDGGTDVLVLVQGEDAVLLALLYQIGGRNPGRGTFTEDASLDPVCRSEGVFVQGPGFFLQLVTFFDGRFEAGRVKVHVGDGGEEPFQDEDVNFLIFGAELPRLVGEESEPLESIEQIVLKVCNVRLLSAHSLNIASDSLCRLLTLMTEHDCFLLIIGFFPGNVVVVVTDFPVL